MAEPTAEGINSVVGSLMAAFVVAGSKLAHCFVLNKLADSVMS